MSEPNYVRVTELDDPDKPWRSVWFCEGSGIYVKVHAKLRSPQRFGRLVWDLTASQCGADGKALQHGDGIAILGGAEKPVTRMLQQHSDPANALYSGPPLAEIDMRDGEIALKPLAGVALETLRQKLRATGLTPSDRTDPEPMTARIDREIRFLIVQVETAVRARCDAGLAV